MEGFGVNTYKLVNAEGKAVYVKYHWKPMGGVETIDRNEAARLAGEDPDIETRDLYETIASGKTVESVIIPLNKHSRQLCELTACLTQASLLSCSQRPSNTLSIYTQTGALQELILTL